MGWEAIIHMQSQWNEITLLGNKIDNNQWNFKWNFSRQHMEREIEVTLTSSTHDVDITINPYSKVVSSFKEALHLENWLGNIPITVHTDFRKQIWKIVSTSDVTIDRKVQWFNACFPHKQEVRNLLQLLSQSNYTLIVVGNYTDLNDSEGKGIWKFVNEDNICSLKTFENDYHVFRKYISHKIKKIHRSNALSLFQGIAKLERSQLVNKVVFQSASTVQCKENLTNVIDLKGTLNEFYCNDCGANGSQTNFINEGQCSNCNGKLRPAITLTGEKEAKEMIDNMTLEVEKANLILCINLDNSNAQLTKSLKNSHNKIVSICQWQNKNFSAAISITSNPEEILGDVANILVPNES
jgi:hypothetical protein